MLLNMALTLQNYPPQLARLKAMRTKPNLQEALAKAENFWFMIRQPNGPLIRQRGACKWALLHWFYRGQKVYRATAHELNVPALPNHPFIALHSSIDDVLKEVEHWWTNDRLRAVEDCDSKHSIKHNDAEQPLRITRST